MRLVFISDTHGNHDFAVPRGDVLVHCGDFTMNGSVGELKAFNDWLKALPHRYKIVIAGNHETTLEEADGNLVSFLLSEPIYLQDSSITIEGVKFYGSPYTPWFWDMAFNLPRGRALALKWDEIPSDTDILITHGPPYGILDCNARGEHAGDEELLEAVERIKPAIHAFGHIHFSRDAAVLGKTLFVNACIANDNPGSSNHPIVVDLIDGKASIAK